MSNFVGIPLDFSVNFLLFLMFSLIFMNIKIDYLLIGIFVGKCVVAVI